MARYAEPTDFEMVEDWEDRGKSDRCLSVLMVGPHHKTYEGVRCQFKAGHAGDHCHRGEDSLASPERRMSCEIFWRAADPATCDCLLTTADGSASLRCQLPGGHVGPHRVNNITWIPVAEKAGK